MLLSTSGGRVVRAAWGAVVSRRAKDFLWRVDAHPHPLPSPGGEKRIPKWRFLR